jgi:large conductance mechanosensitive channel
MSKENEETTNEISQFQKFAFKGRMIEVAVAFIVGAAFQKSVSSLSDHILMPFLNFFIAQTGTNWRKLEWVPFEGMAIEVGQFMGNFIDFLMIAVILYVVYMKIMLPILDAANEIEIQALKTNEKYCSFCFGKLNIEATRCKYCTSWIKD